ncbi:unnamed protein product [Phyllotreta striolata]|uniref:CWH43-like N-terminal domain-containing protein n=1 Tax=Phyllotreta striolata TaxID=444603 RepID=A0A9N9XN18_PHYSR|nr:unnamed protein product [Phyllotreta striolata]
MKYSAKYLHLIIANTLFVTVIITTTLAYYYEHVTSIIPYISDTGTVAPESCIFGQFLNIIWLLRKFQTSLLTHYLHEKTFIISVSMAMYIKFRQVRDILFKHNMTHRNAFNTVTFVIGLIASFGVSIVANFQETNMLYVHWTGAVLAFGGGAVYVCLQTSLYLTITPVIGQILLTKIRIFLSALITVTFVIFFITGMMSYSQFKGESYLKWHRENGGFELHNTSAVTEWICAIAIMVYIMMMGEEFKTINMYEPEVDVGLQRISDN